MKAVGYKTPSPIDAPDSLVDITLPDPVPTGHDLLVEIMAVSVNPVDTKVRKSAGPFEGNEYRILGYDAAGVVRSVGPEVTLFKPGDEVFYAGTIGRQGTNAELHLVDERIVGPKPKTLSFPHAAALPLTSITAWELLFDRFGVPEGPASTGSILIIGGAGGVGSIFIQLARQLTGLTVIATASRPETQAWCLELGAHHVIDHSQPLPPQLASLGIPEVQIVASLTATDKHYPGILDALAPEGKLGLIDDPATFDARLLKRKSISLHWESMFTRSVFQTPTMHRQHELLSRISALVDAGTLRSTFDHEIGPINAETLKKAHALIESGRSQGKVVLAGF
ncbi:MAG TPA: zinc-binding alcohol dehydrogenase family protein [Granulicella sp.]